METQNITLSLPKDTLMKIKILAVQRGTSVSGLLIGELEKLVAQEETYSRAQQRAISGLALAGNLGTGGKPVANRDELHER